MKHFARTSPTRLSDAALLACVKRLAQHDQRTTAALLGHLAELDERRLYLAEGCSSLFTYCTQVLHFSEHAAYDRIEAARAARKFPLILGMVANGELNLTGVRLLAPHLGAVDHREILSAARYKSRRQIEEIVARLRPQPEVLGTIRRLPAAKPISSKEPATPATPPEPSAAAAPPAAPSQAVCPRATRAVVAPLAPERYRVQFTASAATYAKLRRVQDLLRHRIPDGDVAAVVDQALTLLLRHLDKQKLAATDRPRPSREPGSGSRPERELVPGARRDPSRHIPAAVKRLVWKRDGGRCAFVSKSGRRCSERGFLEFHHVRPYGDGGEATPENIQLRCRAHNRYEAELYFGAGRVTARGNDVVRESSAAYEARPPPQRITPPASRARRSAFRPATCCASRRAIRRQRRPDRRSH